MRDLHRLVAGALEATAPLWPDIARAFAWVHRAAHLLKNAEQHPAPAVAHRLDGLCGAMMRHRALSGGLAAAIEHFVKVTRSYRPGLFHCHTVPGLPSTNNTLEGLFGAYRHHERRATGRRAASPAMVLRGPARLPAAALSRLAPLAAPDLAGINHDQWRRLRAQIKERQLQRANRTRFRRNPEAYLRQLETMLPPHAK